MMMLMMMIFPPTAILENITWAKAQSARLRLAAFRANAPRPAFADAAAARTDACLLPFTVIGRPVTRRAAATDFARAARLARAITLPDSPRILLQSAAQQGAFPRCTIDIAFTRSKMYLEICDFPTKRLAPYMCTKGVRRTSRDCGAKSISPTKHTRASSPSLVHIPSQAKCQPIAEHWTRSARNPHARIHGIVLAIFRKCTWSRNSREIAHYLRASSEQMPAK